MAGRKFQNYGLHGEAETRIEQEFERVQTEKFDGMMEVRRAAPEVKALKERWPVLVEIGGNWYIYVRIGNSLIKFAAV